MAETQLTQQQKAVVENRGGTLLVSAAAGSGKTKVLVDRVLNRIVSEGKNINEFLIITYTNAAAAELRAKISKAIAQELGRNPDNRHLSRQMNLMHLSQISTIHAFCGNLIRQYGYLLEVPTDYRMLEDSERQELLERLLETLLEERYASGDEKFLLLADTLGAGRTDKPLSELALSFLEKLQSQPDPKRWLNTQTVRIDPSTELRDTSWGKILLEFAGQQIRWLISRYDWAIAQMEPDELLQPKYLPCYQMQRECLTRMLTALDGPWDEIADALSMEYPNVSVRGYPDAARLDAIKAVKTDGKDLLKSLQRIFAPTSERRRAEQNEVAPALEALIDLVRELDTRFSAEKRRKNVLDFSDQEHLAIRLLVNAATGRPTDVAREVSRRFTEIMVDEYQDSNRVQELIFTAIAAEGDKNRFLVGDVKQSIYGFRQAEPAIFLEKYRGYPRAEDAADGAPRKLILSKNFRSRPEILEAVNDVFGAVMSEQVGDIVYGADERLYPGLPEYPRTEVPHVELHVLELQKLPAGNEEKKYQREAEWVAVRIAKLLHDQVPVRDGNDLRPVRPEDVAVLFRTRDPIGIYSRVLKKAGIPVASGGGEKLFEAPEVKVLYDLLRVLDNPHQDIPLLAVLCSPLFRMSNDQLAKIRSCGTQARFYDAMCACGEDFCVSALKRLGALRRQANSLSADVLVWSLLHETGLLAAYSAMEDGKQRRDNLLAVYQLARIVAAGGHLYLYQLLRSLERAEQAETTTTAEVTGGVVLTTMHKAKGLEYPVVVLADLSRKFNFRELTNSVLFDSEEGIGAKITDLNLRVRYPGLAYEAIRCKKQSVLRSEELRILYVAMTRPKDYLIMTYASESAANCLVRQRDGAGFPAEVWASADAACLGDWVLLAAMSRVESGELFAKSGRPDCTLKVSEYPWLVRYEEVDDDNLPRFIWQPESAAAPAQVLPPVDRLAALLGWKDAHKSATITPSKLTATQLKGRDKDTEAAEGARVEARAPKLRRPEFIVEQKGLSSTERGTAVHLFLQYAQFDRCTTEDGVIGELDRMLDDEFLTEQQTEAVSPQLIAALFQSPLGQKMLGAGQLIREFKFSILVDAGDYYPDVEGEQVLLQGVVDAAILEEDGLTVVDFKTDRVTKESVCQRAESYRGQLSTYRRALERIFHRPVKEMILYFLSIGETVSL